MAPAAAPASNPIDQTGPVDARINGDTSQIERAVASNPHILWVGDTLCYANGSTAVTSVWAFNCQSMLGHYYLSQQIHNFFQFSVRSR
jgi:hypothetical protein